LQKEKDLELAAKIGNSLLEQNRELQERNWYLEEALLSSRESVTQLKSQLEKRTSCYFNAFIELESSQEAQVDAEATTKEDEPGLVDVKLAAIHVQLKLMFQ